MLWSEMHLCEPGYGWYPLGHCAQVVKQITVSAIVILESVHIANTLGDRL
jgi:hypothetical protein